jgi:hypothetical protein
LKLLRIQNIRGGGGLPFFALSERIIANCDFWFYILSFDQKVKTGEKNSCKYKACFQQVPRRNAALKQIFRTM